MAGFVYCNVPRDLAEFEAHMEFQLFHYDGDDGWVENTLFAIHETLRDPTPPSMNRAYEYCHFAVRSAGERYT